MSLAPCLDEQIASDFLAPAVVPLNEDNPAFPAVHAANMRGIIDAINAVACFQAVPVIDTSTSARHAFGQTEFSPQLARGRLAYKFRHRSSPSGLKRLLALRQR